MRGSRTIPTEKIKPSSQVEEVLFRQGDTADIISVILHADEKAPEFTRDFAPYFQSSSIRETLEKIWDFVKKEIRYIKDPQGHERIKSPGKTWADRSGDCKSMSVFIGSLLCNLGIPFVYRFAYYPNPMRPHDKDVNHVYPVAIVNGREYILDAVVDRFNYEEPAEYVIDYDAPCLKKKGIGNTTTTTSVQPGIFLIGGAAVLGLLLGSTLLCSSKSEPE